MSVVNIHRGGQDSSVSIATRHGLDGLVFEPRWGARFSGPIQTGPKPHPASCRMGTGSLCRGTSSHCMALTPPPLLAPGSRWVELSIPSLCVSLACNRTHLHFTNIQEFIYIVKNFQLASGKILVFLCWSTAVIRL
jgi:hypothetical protein